MIKSELIQKVAQSNQHLYQRDVETIVNVILDEIIEALSRGDRVELRGFGAFTVKHRNARRGRNPRTGASVFVEEKFVPFFKTGKELRERLNKHIPGADLDDDDDEDDGENVVHAKAARKPRAVKTASAATKSTAKKPTAAKSAPKPAKART